MLTVAIIDKHPIFRVGLSLFLKENFEVSNLMQQDDFSSTFMGFSQQNPDLIILGISEDSKDLQLHSIKQLKRICPFANLIIYDQALRYDLIIQYLKSGAKGYLAKENDLSELHECITTVLNGKKYLSSTILGLLMETLKNPASRAHEQASAQHILSNREFEIAALYSEGQSTGHIARRLGLKESTISTTKHNIFKKLGVDNIMTLRQKIKKLSIQN